jgi:PAS domain S-box-containing protein
VSRDRYAALYDFAPVGYVNVSHKGLIMEANLTLAELLGVPRPALVQQPFSALVVPDDQDLYYRHRREILESTQRQTCQVRLIRKDAAPFWADIDSTPVNAVDESEIWLQTVITDITKRKQVEEELQQYRGSLEERVEERTAELKSLVEAMTGRELRMADLKDVIKKLRAELVAAGLVPVADDPLKG